MSGSTFLRKIGVAAVATAFALSAAGCGSSGGSTPEENVAFNQLPKCPMDALAKATKPVEITMWERKAVEQTNALTALIDQFNKSQKDVHVTLKLTDSSIQTLEGYRAVNGLVGSNSSVAGSLATEPVPALVSVDGVHMRELADSGAVLPAQSCINATKFNENTIAPIIRAQYSVGGVLWPAYMGVSVPAMAYNADHFRKAGLDPAKAPRTLAEVEADAKQLKAKKVSDHPIAMIIDPMLIETWLTGAGAAIVSDGNGRSADAQRSTLNSAAAVKLFTDLRRMYDEGLIEFYDNDQNQIQHLVAMANGKSSIAFDQSSVATSVQAFVGGDKKAQEQARQMAGSNGLGTSTTTTDYRTGQFPGLTAPGKVSVYGTAWFISQNVPPEQQAAAWKFVEFMYRTSSQATWLSTGAYLPVSPATMKDPKVKEFWESGLAGNWLKVTANEVNVLDSSQPGPLIGPYQTYAQIMRKAISEIRDRPDLTPVQIVAGAEQELTNDLRTYSTNHG